MVYRQNITHRPISIFLWNAKGLIHQENELSAFLLLNSINILLISQAHFTPNFPFKLFGYLTYHCDHSDGSAHAGLAILLKSNIKHTKISSYQNKCIQAINIALTLNHIPTTISSVYFLPGTKISTDDLSHNFSSLGYHFLISGDFNSTHSWWGFSSPNTRGRVINNFFT